MPGKALPTQMNAHRSLEEFRSQCCPFSFINFAVPQIINLHVLCVKAVALNGSALYDILDPAGHAVLTCICQSCWFDSIDR